jgi:hypothetical protein
MSVACEITGSLAKTCENAVGGINRLLLANYDKVTGYVAGIASDPFDYDSVTFATNVITGVTQLNPAEVTTTTAHGVNAGDLVLIFGSSPMDGLVGVQTVLASTGTLTFEIDLDLSGAAAFGASSVELYAAGGAWFEIQMRKGIIGAVVPFQVNPGSNFFEPKVNGIYQGSSKESRDFFDKMSKGKFVALAIGNDGLFKLFGKENGLEIFASGDLQYSSGPAAGDVSGVTFTLTGQESKAYYLVDPAYVPPVFTP